MTGPTYELTLELGDSVPGPILDRITEYAAVSSVLHDSARNVLIVDVHLPQFLVDLDLPMTIANVLQK